MPFTSKPWNGSAARFGSTEAYCKSCLIDTNPAGAEKVQSKCHLPVREPDGTYNVNAIRNALARLNQVQASVDKGRIRARLQSLLRQGGGEPATESRVYTFESRSTDLRDAQIAGREFRGYAAVFDTPWNDRLTKATGYVEKVARGVFRKALSAKPDVPLLIGHQDRHLPLATTGAGTLKLSEDNHGLLAEATLPDNYLGHYAADAIDRGEMRGMSYGIALDPQRDTMLTKGKNGVYTRTVARVQELLDVSLTWEPAYSATSVELRAAGFVATPLQELLVGQEEQGESGGNEEPPPDEGEDEAWWEPEDDPAEASSEQQETPAHRGHWDFYYEQLEWEEDK